MKKFILIFHWIITIGCWLVTVNRHLWAESITVAHKNGNKLEVSTSQPVESVSHRTFHVKPGTYTFEIKPTVVAGWRAIVADNLYTKTITLNGNPQTYYPWGAIEELVTRVQFETLARNPAGMPEDINIVTIKVAYAPGMSICVGIYQEYKSCDGEPVISDYTEDWAEGEGFSIWGNIELSGASRYQFECQDGGESYNLEKRRYKFKFPSPLLAGETIEWIVKHVPPDNGEPTYTKKSWSASGGETETPDDWSLFELDPEEEEGQWSILFPRVVPLATEYINRDDPANNQLTALYGEEAQPFYVTDAHGDGATWLVDTSLINDELISLITDYQWQAEGPQGIVNGPSGVNKWQITGNGLNWPDGWSPGEYIISCTVTLDGIGTFTGKLKQQVGVRTKDVVALSWIDPTKIDLSIYGTNLNWQLLNQWGPGFQADWAAGFPTLLDTDADRRYANARMMQEEAPNPNPPDDFQNAQAVTDFIKDDDNFYRYKLANRWHVKYLWRDNHFDDGVLTVIANNQKHNQVQLGTTKGIPAFIGMEHGITEFGGGNNTASLTCSGQPWWGASKLLSTINYGKPEPDIWNKIWYGLSEAYPTQIQTTKFPTTTVYIQSDNNWQFYKESSLSWGQVANPSTFFFDNPTGPNSYVTRP